MQITFLGGARTVTGSRFLLDTGKARVLIDCGMFQGSPNEVMRNRVPLGVDPTTLDAVVLTHAHLDHCGLLPLLVREGYDGTIVCTDATGELARIVLLDSAKLQTEFAKRERRRETKDPRWAAEDDRRERAAYYEAVAEAKAGEAGFGPPPASDGTEPDMPEAPVAERAAAGESDASAEATDTPVATPSAPTSASEVDDRSTGGRGTDDRGTGSAHGDVTRAGTPGGGRDPETELREQPPVVELDLDEPLYEEDDALATMRKVRSLAYGQEREIAPGVHVTLHDAGHILGSAIVRVRVADDPRERGTVIVFSGDLGRPGTPIIRDPTPLDDADYVVVESTYGGREHEPGDDSVRILAETVREVAQRRGVLLIPAFSIGRTQEIIWYLDRLVAAGDVPAIPLYLDSPMATKASDVYRGHPDAYDEETARLLASSESPLEYPNEIVVQSAQESIAIGTSKRPHAILASNGMLTGGRSVSHARDLLDDPLATVLFVGYQGQGTLGRHLLEGVERARVGGKDVEVRATIRQIDGFSAHADEPELLAWLGNFIRGRRPGDAGVPKRVFLVHGDPPAQEALKPKVEALGLPTTIPAWHETIAL